MNHKFGLTTYSLNLIVNAIVVWNTVYMQVAVQHLRNSGYEINEADLEHLSPVRYEHINVFGKYSFEAPSVLTDQDCDLF